MAYRVVIVEDHRIMREGVKALLERSGEFAVIGEADTGTEGVGLAQETHADIAIVDIGLPGLNGIEGHARDPAPCAKHKGGYPFDV